MNVQASYNWNNKSSVVSAGIKPVRIGGLAVIIIGGMMFPVRGIGSQPASFTPIMPSNAIY